MLQRAAAAASERTAEQATMTVDSLYIAQAKAGSPNPATRQAIDGLFQLVNNPSSYNAPPRRPASAPSRSRSAFSLINP